MSYEIKVNDYGFFEIHWTVGRRTKRKSLRTKDPKLAYSRASYYLDQDKREVENRHDPDVAYLIDYYMKNHADEKVVDTIRVGIINRHLIAHFGKHKPHTISPETVQIYRKKREKGEIGQPAGAGTLRRELGHLTAVLNFAGKRQLVKRDAIPFIERPDAPPPKQRWLTVEEIGRVSALAHGRGRVELFFHIAVRTASRPTAIIELTWDKINWEQNLIEFGKGDKKVRRSKRRATVPISDKLRPFLQAAYDRDLQNVGGDVERVRRLAVLGSHQSIRTTFNNLMEDAGMPEVTPHTLRHTWATHASMSGVPMNEVARVLGDTLATVEKVYAKFAPGYLKPAVNAVNF